MVIANSLVAFGDQNGVIRVLEAAENSTPPFHTYHVGKGLHTSAVTDLAFSSDDWLLATGSADNGVCVLDMSTQTDVHSIYNAHYDSLKQVAFQPDNDSVLVTSSRDGDVRLWDLRLNSRKPQLAMNAGGKETVSVGRHREGQLREPSNFSSIVGGHQTHPRILAER